VKGEWRKFEKSMDGPPFVVSAIVNRESSTTALIDSGCLSYGLIDSRYVQKHGLQRIQIQPRAMVGFDAPTQGQITEVTTVQLDIGGY
jgi:hypothetical protein